MDCTPLKHFHRLCHIHHPLQAMIHEVMTGTETFFQALLKFIYKITVAILLSSAAINIHTWKGGWLTSRLLLAQVGCKK